MKEIVQKLRDFILDDSVFFNLAKKYSFQYREFSPLKDYCQVIWNRKIKNWECVDDGYICIKQDDQLDRKKANCFLINLGINGFKWENLFDEMEKCFIEDLANKIEEEDIPSFREEKSEEYKNMREAFFKENKLDIINGWFTFRETQSDSIIIIKPNIEEFIQNELRRLQESFLIRKTIIY